jgi:hypothetical protein
MPLTKSSAISPATRPATASTPVTDMPTTIHGPEPWSSGSSRPGPSQGAEQPDLIAVASSANAFCGWVANWSYSGTPPRTTRRSMRAASVRLSAASTAVATARDPTGYSTRGTTARLSPFVRHRINMPGRYSFQFPRPARRHAAPAYPGRRRRRVIPQGTAGPDGGSAHGMRANGKGTSP